MPRRGLLPRLGEDLAASARSFDPRPPGPLWPAGEFREIDVRADLRIAKPTGEVLFSRESFGRFRFRSREWNRELFFTFTVNLTGAPPADYVLGVRLLDIVSGKETDLTLPFSLVAR